MMLSDTSQPEVTIHCIIPFIWKCPAQEYLKRKKAERRKEWKELLMGMGFMSIIAKCGLREWCLSYRCEYTNILDYILEACMLCWNYLSWKSLLLSLTHIHTHTHKQYTYLYFNYVGLICPLPKLLSVMQVIYLELRGAPKNILPTSFFFK